MPEEKRDRNQKLIQSVVFKGGSISDAAREHGLSHAGAQNVIHRWARRNWIDHGYVAVIRVRAKEKWPERFKKEEPVW